MPADTLYSETCVRTAAVKSLLTVTALLQQKRWSECCAQLRQPFANSLYRAWLK